MENLVVTKPQIITSVQKALVTGRNFIIKQSPIILAGAAVAGVATTGVLAVRAGIRANEIIKEEENAKGDVLTTKEKMEACWKPFIPPIVSGFLTVGAIIASTTISQKRQTALAGLYALSETALKEYQDKIEQKYGAKGAQAIKDEINGDRVKAVDTPPWENYPFPTDECLCFDPLTSRYFMSSVQKLRIAEATINSQIYGGDMCASLNELYSLINSPQLDCCGMGDEIGWSISHPCEMQFTSTLTSDMKPCLVLDYTSGGGPTYNYRDI